MNKEQVITNIELLRSHRIEGKVRYSLLLVRYSLFIFLLSFGKNASAQVQDTIRLRNPSFEWDRPIKNIIPQGWKSCGWRHESPPDVHSQMTTHYKVKHTPQKGKKFLGLVVRSNFTKEAIAQKLVKPLLENKTYQMSLFVSQAEKFISKDSKTRLKANYTTPAIIRIWGINHKCETQELLFESEPISNIEWKKLNIEFSPTKEHRHLMIEAFFSRITDNSYNGHVLLDNISPIIEIN